MTDNNANALPAHGLQRLIQDRRGDRTYEALSRDCGGKPTKDNLIRLALDPYKTFPSSQVLMGLSRGLRVRLIDVLIAAGVSVGLPIQSGLDHERDLILPKAGTLPRESQDLLLSMADQMLWWQEQVDQESAASAETERAEEPAKDNVTELRPRTTQGPDWQKTPADKGEPGINPEDLPES